jgi:hypothetical protein
MIEVGGGGLFFYCVWLGDTLGVIVGACRRFVSPPPNQVPLDTTVFQLGGGEAYCTIPFLKTLLQPLLDTFQIFRLLLQRVTPISDIFKISKLRSSNAIKSRYG